MIRQVNVKTGAVTIIDQDAPSFLPTTDERRAVAVLDKTAFCLRLKDLKILPLDEAVAAARGDWPATFSGFASQLSADAAAEAQIEWATRQNIRYSAPLLQQLALAFAGGNQTLATATLDAIFAI